MFERQITSGPSQRSGEPPGPWGVPNKVSLCASDDGFRRGRSFAETAHGECRWTVRFHEQALNQTHFPELSSVVFAVKLGSFANFQEVERQKTKLTQML